MINKFSKFGFLILLSWIFINNSNAQTPVCNLQLGVFEFNPVQARLTEYSLDNVKVVLTDLATDKSVESSNLARMPLFNNLASGNYKIEVSKNGYERRIKEFDLSCNNNETIEVISKPIYLQKGDTDKITEFQSTIFGVKDNTEKSESDTALISGRAVKLKKPEFPAAARAVRAVGAVNVQIIIDEDGEVISAKAISGHPLLRNAAEKAARDSRFAPTFLQGKPVKITGIVVYNFAP